MNKFKKRDLLIVSGMSGSGKSTALKSLEDMGFMCIDNYPPELIKHLPSLVLNYKELNTRVAITVDVRTIKSIKKFIKVFEEIEQLNISYSTLFLDSNDSTLLKRYKETRRLHPFMENTNLDLELSIQQERDFMHVVQDYSDVIIDTSLIGTSELKQRIINLFGNDTDGRLNVHLVSFGFKYGSLRDADILFDVRCLKNPYYDLSLRHLTGNDKEVRDFVMEKKEAQGLFKHIKDYLEYSIPLYVLEGKSQLVVGIACTGGKHRSVTFAKLLSERIAITGVNVTLEHRDINRV